VVQQRPLQPLPVFRTKKKEEEGEKGTPTAFQIVLRDRLDAAGPL
jgi:hypothetical protein